MAKKFAVIDYEDGTCTIQSGEYQPGIDLYVGFDSEGKESYKKCDVIKTSFATLVVDEVFDTVGEAKAAAGSLEILNFGELD